MKILSLISIFLGLACSGLPAQNSPTISAQPTNLVGIQGSDATVTFHFFGVFATNNYSRNSMIPLQLLVQGNPYFQTILVDETNAADAVWSNYTKSNLWVNVGSIPGWHEVWIGLCGRDDAPTNAVWQKIWLNLDLGPFLVVTNPSTVSTVATPWFQLQGYASVPLVSLTYDLTNSTGLLTNQLAFLVGQAFDTNFWANTYQTFQGYDVHLAPGLNTITLHAVDVTGNEISTNASVSLDVSRATPPS